MFRLALASIFFAHAAGAQVHEWEHRPLSLEQCIEIAVEHNFTIQITRYNPEISLYNLRGSYGAYDPVFNSSAEHGYSLSSGGIDAEGRSFSGTETDTDSISAGITGLLPWGTTYRIGGNLTDQSGNRASVSVGTNVVSFTTNTFIDINNPSNSLSLIVPVFDTTQGRSLFETTSGRAGALQLSQPLLKDFWIDATRLVIFINKKELEKSEADFRDQIMTTVTSVENAYFALIGLEENVKVQQKALELAERTLAENTKRVEVGAMSPLDQKQAESQVATSRSDLIAAMAAAGTQQRVLKALLSDDYTNQWANVVIMPTDKLIAVPQHYDLQESWRKGLAQGGSPGLRQRRLTLEEQNARIRLQRNQLFPALDVIGSYGYSGSSREFSGAIDRIRSGDQPFWTIGAQLSMPLSQTSARNNLKADKAAREQMALVLKAQEQSTLIQIENDIGSARSRFESVGATREAVLYAEAALEAEQTKFENGKSTLFNVLELQSQLTEKRSAEIRALADYNFILAALAFDEGSTLERRRIDLKVVRER
jgi:outer membrane protein TolC